MERRFIEEHFPIKEISKESAKEKSIRHGHISTLHLWWARRPLAVTRATVYASLIPATADAKKLRNAKDSIVELSLWKNSLNKTVINKARKRIMDCNKSAPKVLDPFSGGGSIPLESLRLGCEAYASDYNPVASLIAKATIGTLFRNQTNGRGGASLNPQTKNRLISDVQKWSQHVLGEAKKEIEPFFPDDKRGESPVGYLWSRSIPCQNPKCNREIPLIKQFWLANKPTRKIALFPHVVNKTVRFKIVGDGAELPEGFDPKKGTVSRGIATCLVCGYVVDGKKIKELFAERKNGETLNAVILNSAGKPGKKYRVASPKDLGVFTKAQLKLAERQNVLREKLGMSPVPDEPTPEGRGRGAERAFSLRSYSMNTWGELFNDRQKLVLLVFLEKILDAHEKIQKEEKPERANDILLYLSIIFDRLVDKNSNLVFYNAVGEKIEHVFGRAALGMVWDYVELNPFTDVGWKNMEKWVLGVLAHLARIDGKPGLAKHASATRLPFSDGFFDAVITDPPYYDNIPYSHLSDFFYVWLKRLAGRQFPDLFSTPLTPKTDEIVTYSNGPEGWKGGKDFFEKMLKKSFTEMHRVLKPDGITVIVYAHKSTEGWETLINSLLQSGFVVTAAWPVHTEMRTRLRATDSATLASSIYMVARKRKKEPVGFYGEVKSELRKYLNGKLEHLWKEGISGADFFIAAIGSAIEVFGKYEKVVDDGDAEIKTLRLLNDVRSIVTDYAIGKVIRGEFSDRISKITRFYVLWRWAYGEAKVPFDDALKLAQSVGIDIGHEWNKGFILKESENIRLLGPADRDAAKLEKSTELVDVLHHVLLLWKNKKTTELDRLLKESGLDKSDMFKRVGQAISESLPPDSAEKRWLDGFLTGFRVRDSQDGTQTKLF